MKVSEAVLLLKSEEHIESYVKMLFSNLILTLVFYTQGKGKEKKHYLYGGDQYEIRKNSTYSCVQAR